LILEEDATRSITGDESHKENTYQRSVSLSFSLQILSREGVTMRGDATMQKTTSGVPQRASRPTADVTQEYDDDTVGSMPRSALVWRATNTQPHNAVTQPLPASRHRVSGSTRFLLVVLLILCCAFLFNGLVMPAIASIANHLKYGNAQIATFDLQNRHWITEETNGTVRIVITSDDARHNQILTTFVSGAPNHALVSLSQDGNNIDCAINGTYTMSLVSDGQGGYKWKTN